MTPATDPTWPRCWGHDNSLHWCPTIAEYLRRGEDADGIEPGMRYCVPVVPGEDFYAEVSIDLELAPGMAPIHLVLPSDPFSSEERTDYLGVWTKGEGRLTMAATLTDWIEAHRPEKCTAATHSFKQEMMLQSWIKSPANDEKVNFWCLAYYGMCVICWSGIRASGAPGDGEFHASDFGVDTTTVKPVGRNQNAVNQALQNRFRS